MATFGRVLYWFTTVIAALLCIFGALLLNSPEQIIALFLFGPAIVIYPVGRIIRYALAENEPPRDYKPKSEFQQQHHEQRKEENEKIVIHSSKEKMKLYLISGLSFVIVLAVLLIYDTSLNEDLLKLSMIWACVLIFSIGSSLFTINIIRHVPKISLDRDGVSIFSTFTCVSRKWTDVGPFSLDTQFIPPKTIYYACAFSDFHHNLLIAHNEPQAAAITAADFIFALNEMPPGKNMHSAQEFVDALNMWRKEYGALETNIRNSETTERFHKLNTKINRTYYIYHIITFVCLSVFYFVVFH